ncbi:MAG: tetratricopeptide repeat protein [Devosia sp.]
MTLKYLFIVGLVLLAACGGSAAQGAADYATAVKYMHGQGVAKDEQKAMTYLQKAVEAGSDRAQLALGYFYLQGTGGVAKDTVKAVEFFTMAAKQGNRDAQYNVGLAYVRGEGVEKDLVQAYEWFEKAAYQDDAGAQYNLGVMSINGEGREADPLLAHIWFRLAHEKTYGGADKGMEAAKSDMTEDQIKEIERAYAKIARKIRKPTGM